MTCMEPAPQSAAASPLQNQAPRARTGLRVFTFEEADREDRAYWQSRSPMDRLRHVETLRELNY